MQAAPGPRNESCIAALRSRGDDFFKNVKLTGSQWQRSEVMSLAQRLRINPRTEEKFSILNTGGDYHGKGTYCEKSSGADTVAAFYGSRSMGKGYGADDEPGLWPDHDALVAGGMASIRTGPLGVRSTRKTSPRSFRNRGSTA